MVAPRPHRHAVVVLLYLARRRLEWAVRRRLRRLAPLRPVALGAVPFGTTAGLVAAAHTNSLVFLLPAACALVAGVTAPAASLIKARQWTDFERCFWAYVERLADAPPEPA